MVDIKKKKSYEKHVKRVFINQSLDFSKIDMNGKSILLAQCSNEI